MREPMVFTVILNTNRRDDTLACLASLEEGDYDNHSIIVLDNNSADGSVQAVSTSFPAVHIVRLNENRGYAGNNNVGMRAALDQGAEWIFILNEDTVLAPDCLSRLVEVGESDSRIGMVGPMVYHYSEPEIIQSAGGWVNRVWESGHIGKNERDRGQFATPRSVDWLTGCGILARREVLEQVGLLDERFFIYWEETEWCIRARRAGWVLVHVPGARLWHKGVQTNYCPKPSNTYYSTRNRFIAMAKHHASALAWTVAWGQTLRTLGSWTLKPKFRSMRPHRDAMWQGAMDFMAGRYGKQAP